MKQETGNRIFDQQCRELSIQVTLNGFSFAISERGQLIYASTSSSCDFGDAHQYQTITVGWGSDAVVLVPASEFVVDRAVAYLQAANHFGLNDVALSSASIDPMIVAVWSADRALVETLVAAFPQAVHYHNLEIDIALASMQIEPSEPSAKPYRAVRIAVVENRANVVVFNNQGLYAAETISFDTPDDLLYFVMRLASVDHQIEFVAADTTPYQSLFKGQYPYCQFINTHDMYHSSILRCE